MRRRGRSCLLKSRQGRGCEATDFESYLHGRLRCSAFDVVVRVSKAKPRAARLFLNSLECTLHLSRYNSRPKLYAYLLKIWEESNL